MINPPRSVDIDIMDAPLTPKATVDRTYDYKDLLTAYLDAGRYSKSEPYKVLGDYYQWMVDALSQCLDVELDPHKPGVRIIDCATAHSRHHLLFLHGLLSCYNDIQGTWQFQTLFTWLGPFYEKHDSVFKDHQQRYKHDLFQAMCEAFEIAYPDKSTATVTSRQLRDAGVDDRQPPDFWAIWHAETDW